MGLTKYKYENQTCPQKKQTKFVSKVWTRLQNQNISVVQSDVKIENKYQMSTRKIKALGKEVLKLPQMYSL